MTPETLELATNCYRNITWYEARLKYLDNDIRDTFKGLSLGYASKETKEAVKELLKKDLEETIAHYKKALEDL